MIQKTIREFNNVPYTNAEGAELIKEYDDRTKSGIDGYNSIAELAAKMVALEQALSEQEPIENTYATIADMLADQINQTDGYIQFVADASGDATVDAGYAYYEFLGGPLEVQGQITDYRKLSEEESMNVVGDNTSVPLKYFYLQKSGYILFTQDVANWYGLQIGPHNVGWFTHGSFFALNIGADPLMVEPRSPGIAIPFNCVLKSANIVRHLTNVQRDQNIKFIAHTPSSSSNALNVREILSISLNNYDANFKLSEGVDFIIENSVQLYKGDIVTMVINQGIDASGAATNWTFNLEFEETI